MLSYFNPKKAKKSSAENQHSEKATKTEEPVLNDEDEAFLQRIMSETEDIPPPLPERPQDLRVAGDSIDNDAQLVLVRGVQDAPIPHSPETPKDVVLGIDGKDKGKEKPKSKKTRWSWLRRDSGDSKRKASATGLHSAAEGFKLPGAKSTEKGTATPNEAKKENDEMMAVLEQLNLAAVNNRVFSISQESQDLLKQFNLVLKDLVNGVPTAYRDLESLLTNSEQQLQRMYGSLPSFLQQLIEKLPERFTYALGPEILATLAERQGLKSEYITKGVDAAAKMGLKIKTPSLKDLISKQGAIVAMLRSIMTFLRSRFPAVVGMNVLWSLALFLLLFVFWYCHKRGRQVRLENERLLTEKESAELEARIAADLAYEPSPHTSPTEYRTTAPEGAPIEEVRAGIDESNTAASSSGQCKE